MRRHVVSLLAFVAAGTSLAAAQDVQFGTAAGLTVPYGSSSQFASYGGLANTGWNFGMVMGVGVPGLPVSLRIDAGYSHANGDQQQEGAFPSGGSLAWSDQFTMWTAAANLIFPVIQGEGNSQFYVIGGVGLYSTRVVQTIGTVGSSGSAYVENSVVNALGFSGGLGFRTGKIFAEARYTYVKDGMPYPFTPNATTSMRMIPITVGAFF